MTNCRHGIPKGQPCRECDGLPKTPERTVTRLQIEERRAVALECEKNCDNDNDKAYYQGMRHCCDFLIRLTQ